MQVVSSGQVICHLSGNLVPGSNLLLAGDNLGRLDPGQTFDYRRQRKKPDRVAGAEAGGGAGEGTGAGAGAGAGAVTPLHGYLAWSNCTVCSSATSPSFSGYHCITSIHCITPEYTTLHYTALH